MEAHPPPVAEAVIEVCQNGSRWLIRSSDRLFSGVFIDKRSARRHAEAEVETHPGHVVVIRDGKAA